MIGGRVDRAAVIYISMTKTKYFRNDGLGWTCIQCEADLGIKHPTKVHARFFTEGEAESRIGDLENRALARWADESRRTLVCPRCLTSEELDPR